MRNPHRVVVAAGKNYLGQVTATTAYVYPEDPNRAALDAKPVALLAEGRHHLAGDAGGGLAPLLIVFSSGQAILSRARDFPLLLLASWLVSDVVTSQLAFANSWISDASRMRFHYEVPGLLLAVLMIRAAVQWARRRADNTLTRKAPGLPGR